MDKLSRKKAIRSALIASVSGVSIFTMSPPSKAQAGPPTDGSCVSGAINVPLSNGDTVIFSLPTGGSCDITTGVYKDHNTGGTTPLAAGTYALSSGSELVVKGDGTMGIIGTFNLLTGACPPGDPSGFCKFSNFQKDGGINPNWLTGLTLSGTGKLSSGSNISFSVSSDTVVVSNAFGHLANGNYTMANGQTMTVTTGGVVDPDTWGSILDLLESTAGP
jgi:hypothetical protein